MECVALYARRSLQDIRKQANSLNMQLDWAAGLCHQRDWKVSAIYADAGGHSDDINRKRLRRLLLDVRDGKVTRVITMMHDRLARGQDLALILRWLGAFKCKVTMGNIPEDVGDSADLILRFMMGLDEHFLKLLRTRTSMALKHLQAKGVRVGRPMSAFDWDETNRNFKPKPWVEELEQLAEKELMRDIVRSERFKSDDGRPFSYWALVKIRRYYKAYKEGRLQQEIERMRGKTYRALNKRTMARAEATKEFELWLRTNLPLNVRLLSLPGEE